MENNFQNFLTSKKFFLIVGVLVFLLVILVIITGASPKKPIPVDRVQFTQNESVVNAPQNNAVSSPENRVENFSPEVQRAIAEQTKVDREYSDWQQTIQDNYPWRKKLPLTSEKYYVYFDLNNKVLIGRFYLTSSDNETQIKEDIVRQLQAIQVPVDSFKFDWQVFAK